jgi:hypothetical protein
MNPLISLSALCYSLQVTENQRKWKKNYRYGPGIKVESVMTEGVNRFKIVTNP